MQNECEVRIERLWVDERTQRCRLELRTRDRTRALWLPIGIVEAALCERLEPSDGGSDPLALAHAALQASGVVIEAGRLAALPDGALRGELTLRAADGTRRRVHGRAIDVTLLCARAGATLHAPASRLVAAGDVSD
ncbi:MAG: hypothetical protein D6776_00705 [Planctomycetota bacterium]|nr:MAG: hypothetical protein D6776_00705 [Planctomycetota bacterium]